MKIELEVCIKEGDLNEKMFRHVFDEFVKFSPVSFTRKYKTFNWDLNEFLKILKTYKGENFLSVSDAKASLFAIGSTGTHTPHISISLVQEETFFSPLIPKVGEFLKKFHFFTSAYIYNSEYVEVQSDFSEQNMQGRNYPKEILDTIRNTPTREGVWGKEYDTRFNPGRKILIGHTWLVSAWKMWFGEGFFKLVPKERIKQFPHAYKIEEPLEGIIFVQLFEKIDESQSPDSMFRQWKWQEWIGFDEMIEKYK